LRPGGRLYLNGNGLGYYIYRWKSNANATETFSPQRSAALSFLNTLVYRETKQAPREGQLIIDPEEMAEALRAAGFAIVAQGGDGTIRIDAAAPAPKPFFRSEYYGLCPAVMRFWRRGFRRDGRWRRCPGQGAVLRSYPWSLFFLEALWNAPTTRLAAVVTRPVPVGPAGSPAHVNPVAQWHGAQDRHCPLLTFCHVAR
jgi:hypothetical protein